MKKNLLLKAKKSNNKIGLSLISFFVLLICFTFIFSSTYAQEKGKKEKTMKIKIMKEENGVITSFDTTITNPDENFNADDLLKEYNFNITTTIDSLNMDSIITEVNGIDIDLPNIDSIITNVKCTDSLGKKIIIIDNGIVIEDKNDNDNNKVIVKTIKSDCKNNHSKFIVKNGKKHSKSNKHSELYVFKCKNDSVNCNFNIETINTNDNKCKVIVCKMKIEDLNDKDKKMLKDKLNITETEELKINNLLFYPNPSKGEFKLEFELKSAGNTEIKIVDSMGKEVYNEKLDNFSGKYSKKLDLSKETKGAYIVIIRQNGKGKTQKLILK